MSSDNYDYIIVNLKVFAHVARNQRICMTSKGYFTIEKEYIWQSIKRFLYGESREKLIRDINFLISQVYAQIKLLITSKHLDDEEESDSKRAILNKIGSIYRELERSLTGFENLKSTYEADKLMIGELELIIDKITAHMKEIELKLPRVSEIISPFLIDKVN